MYPTMAVCWIMIVQTYLSSASIHFTFIPVPRNKQKQRVMGESVLKISEEAKKKKEGNNLEKLIISIIYKLKELLPFHF